MCHSILEPWNLEKHGAIDPGILEPWPWNLKTLEPFNPWTPASLASWRKLGTLPPWPCNLGTLVSKVHATVPEKGSFKGLGKDSSIPTQIPGSRFQEGSSKVPVRFQGCSVFSGCAFLCHHSPAPEIEPQKIRCWGWFNMIRIKELQTYSSEKDQLQPHFWPFHTSMVYAAFFGATWNWVLSWIPQNFEGLRRVRGFLKHKVGHLKISIAPE